MTKDVISGPHQTQPIHVAAVDNDETFLQEVKNALNGAASCFNVWTFRSPEELEQAVNFAQSTDRPARAPVDLLLLDINFGHAPGTEPRILELIKYRNDHLSDPRPIILSAWLNTIPPKLLNS